jgi:SM-20-related protein
VTYPLELRGALAGAALERVRRDMRAAAGSPAGLLGDVRSSARRATRLTPPDDTRAEVTALLERHRARVQEHFDRELDGCEEPQFLRYAPGDYFVPHQDGNTPLIHDESRFRKVSVVIFLSEQSGEPRAGTFGGGSLVLHSAAGDSLSLAPPPGTLVAFPAETTHEVTPIVHGERLSIVSWYRHEPGGAAGS